MLRSERLILREFSASDFEQVHLYAVDDDVVRYMEWGPNSEEATREFLERAHAFAQETPRRNFELAILEAKTGRLAGGIGLHTSDSQGNLGYCLARSAWGQGFATEAAQLMIRFGFDSLGLHRVWARCDSENSKSLRVLEKLGMRREGLAQQDCQIRGQWRDTFFYAVLAEEWNNRTD